MGQDVPSEVPMKAVGPAKEPDTPPAREAAKEPTKELQKPKDIWDKAAVISSFLSNVVIAVVGLIVTASIQRTQIATSNIATQAQLDFAKSNSDRKARLEQSKLTADLLTC